LRKVKKRVMSRASEDASELKNPTR